MTRENKWHLVKHATRGVAWSQIHVIAFIRDPEIGDFFVYDNDCQRPDRKGWPKSGTSRGFGECRE